MAAHATSLATAIEASTSAEPEPGQLDYREALEVCKHVVFANAIATSDQLGDVPLLTASEARWALCLSRMPESARTVIRLWLLSVHVNLKRLEQDAFVREAEVWSLEDIKAAALTVESAVQARLFELGGPGAIVRDRKHAADLWNAQSQAHRAVLARTGSRKEAKSIQRQAAAGRRPLTVCRGAQLRKLPEVELRRVAPAYLERYPDRIATLGYGDGCGMIIVDSLEPRHPKKYCARCSARTGQTMNAGLMKGALARVRHHWGLSR